MKNKLLLIASTVALLTVPNKNFGQAPSMGTTSNFALFSTVGALNISGISQITGDIGTNSGSTTVFVNINGNIHDQDGASGQCAADLLSLYNDLDAAVPTFFIAPLMGGGDTLIAGVYYVFGASTLDLDLTLDASGNPNAIFIFQLEGPLSTGANSKVKLINGAKACNVFWKVEGLVSMASGSTMRGNIIANNAAINMTAGDTLEGRAFSTAGAITIDGSMVYTPTGCGSVVLNGPTAPAMGTTECFGIFSSDGPVTNAGITTVTGDVGTNVGLTSGYDPLTVNGTIHPIPDVATSQCAADLLSMSTYLNSLTADIELRIPAQFGHNLVLTPHTYIMNGAVSLTDTLYLNAEGYTNAVFVIQVFGAFATSVYSKVILINGTQAKNVYWQVNGAVNIADYSIFNGTIVANNGAIDLATGVSVSGRILSTTGAVQTAADTVITPTTCAQIGIIESNSVKTTDAVSIYPNPFSSNATIVMNKTAASYKAEMKLYNILGAEVLSTTLMKKSTTIDTINLPAGIYFYQITDDNKMIQTGRLIAE